MLEILRRALTGICSGCNQLPHFQIFKVTEKTEGIHYESRILYFGKVRISVNIFLSMNYNTGLVLPRLRTNLDSREIGNEASGSINNKNFSTT